MTENEIFSRLLTVLESYRASEKDGKVAEYHSPNALGKILDLYGSEKNGDWENIFEWVEKYLAYSVNTMDCMLPKTYVETESNIELGCFLSRLFCLHFLGK